MDVQTSLLGLDAPRGRTVSQSLIASDIPLPEGRDAAEVLCAHARCLVESAECVPGQVRLSGRLELFLVCRAMSGDAYGFSAISSFSDTLALESACAGDAAQTGAQVLECTVTPDGMRLRLSAVLELNALVYAPVTTPFLTDVTGGAGVEKRVTRLEARRRVQLAEASLRVREEADANGVLRVLLYHGACQTVQMNYTGASACEAEGKLLVTVLVEREDGTLSTMVLTLPFACSFDAPYLPSAWAACTIESLSAVATDVSFGLIDVEAVLRVRLCGVESSESSVLLDAYDGSGSFTCKRSDFDRLTLEGAVQRSFNIQENVAVPKHLPDAAAPVYAAAMPVVTGVTDSGGQLGADVMLLTSVVYRCAEGKLHGFTEDIPVQLELNAGFTDCAEVCVQALTVAPGGAGRTLSVGYTLTADALLYRSEPVSLASELVGGCAPCPYGGILIYCADAGETLWDVGKRFSVPLAALQGWNGALPEPLAEGQAIVVMK